MVFTVRDFQDLLAILDNHPEWRMELLRRLLSERFLALPDAVDELKVALTRLAEAQQRTDEKLQALAEAQRRTDEKLQALAEAQRRTDEKVQALAEAQQRTEEALRLTQQEVKALAEAQRRTDSKVDILSQTVAETQKQVTDLAYKVARLETVIGATVEDEAANVAMVVLTQKGYRFLDDPVFLRWDGEIDVVLRSFDPEGVQLWVLIEAKARISGSDVRRWFNRVHSKEWQQALAEQGVLGPYLVYIHGIRVDAAAKSEAANRGVGLMYGQGELVTPTGLVYPEEGTDQAEA